MHRIFFFGSTRLLPFIYFGSISHALFASKNVSITSTKREVSSNGFQFVPVFVLYFVEWCVIVWLWCLSKFHENHARMWLTAFLTTSQMRSYHSDQVGVEPIRTWHECLRMFKYHYLFLSFHSQITFHGLNCPNANSLACRSESCFDVVCAYLCTYNC